MIVIGHRGANKEALENSWSAYERAIDAGATRIELDVHLTRDGEIVIIHENVSHLSRAQSEKIKLINGEAIPFLDEVLARLLPRVEINVEIKGPSTILANRVGKLLRAHADPQRIIVSCFYPQPLIFFAENYPEFPRACLWGDRPHWPFFSHFAPLIMMQRCRATIFHPVTHWLDENLMDQARARQWQVFPYVEMKGEDADRAKLWATMLALGVDGLCTNFPREFKHWLQEVERSAGLVQALSSPRR
jgi:glycerophosphoryl diester phosphodiesterase